MNLLTLRGFGHVVHQKDRFGASEPSLLSDRCLSLPFFRVRTASRPSLTPFPEDSALQTCRDRNRRNYEKLVAKKAKLPEHSINLMSPCQIISIRLAHREPVSNKTPTASFLLRNGQYDRQSSRKTLHTCCLTKTLGLAYASKSPRRPIKTAERLRDQELACMQKVVVSRGTKSACSSTRASLATPRVQQTLRPKSPMLPVGSVQPWKLAPSKDFMR